MYFGQKKENNGEIEESCWVLTLPAAKRLFFEYRSKGLGWLALERVLFLGNKQQYDKAG